MNFILRGILTIKEKKGRAIILLAIMLTVCIVMLASFGIQSGADAAAILAREKLGAEVTISQDMQSMMDKQREESSSLSADGKPERINMERVLVPLEYADILSENEHVDGYLASNETTANLTDLLAVGASEEEEETEETETTDNNMMPHGDGMDISKENMGGGGMKMMGNGDVKILGVNNYLMTSQYINGEISLIDGREITEDDLNSNVIMVEETFAEENDLSVGDTFSIEAVSFVRPGSEEEETEEETTTIQVEVVGIFTSYEEVSSMGFKDTASLPYNNMIAPYTLVSALNEEETTGVDSLVFYIDDPINVDSYVEWAESTDIDLDTYSVDAGSKEYESMMEPIENVASFSKITIIIVTIFGGLILALIIMLSIKSRINEIGMLMALGERRIKIIGQLLVEAIVVLAIAVGLSLCTGGVISDKVANILLENELSSTEEVSTQGSANEGMGGPGGMMGRPTGGNMPGGFKGETETTERIEELDVSISSDNILGMAGLSFVVVIVATILPSIIIMRYNPKRILSNHS